MTNDTEHQLTGYELAVIGMAGRFPGSGSVNEFWENIKNGRTGITFFTDEELIEQGVPGSMLEHPNYVKAKGVIDNAEYFDALFFDYTLRDAETMDPQLRLLLECSWHALEDGGYNPDTFGGSIGYYVGASSHYSWLGLVQERVKDMSQMVGALSLNDQFSMSTQVSYRLNLKGPVVTLNTACSTSLVAIHMASQALLSGECDMALAGGVSIRLPLRDGYFYQEGMVLSPDGYCRAFDAKAKGCVNGTGIGVVLLKSLENAMEDRDHIYAVIKGTAVNNDGNRRVGFSAPSIEGQSEVIRMAQQVADVHPGTIGYIEAHGTGTALGDPVEIRALTRAFDTGKKKTCRIGAVKTNVGHLDAAAGVTGFIKTVLTVYHRMIPPSLNFESPNPQIDFENSPFVVNTELLPWESDGEFPLRAGVSSFGIGGTNAHIVLEQAPPLPREEVSPAAADDPCLLILSARSASALERNTQKLADYLRNNSDVNINMADVAFTLQMGRKSFKHRRAFVCSGAQEAVDMLEKGSKSIHTHEVKTQKPPVVFMFSGLGGQYVNMGYGLYQNEPLFRETMDRGFDVLNHLLASFETGIPDVKTIVYPGGDQPADPAQLQRPEVLQPLMFIFEYALAQLLTGWGIEPYAMIGYSFGEYTAACTSGVLTFEDALTLIVERGELVKETAEGAMLNVPMTAEELLPLLGAYPSLSLAIDNGPSCIVAGIPETVGALEKELKERKCMTMRLNANRAIHTRLMAPILDGFREKVAEVSLSAPQVRYISNVTGTWITPEDAADPLYWARHLGETVRFETGIRELVKEPGTIFIEIGPGRDLSSMIHRCLQENQKTVNLIRPQGKKIEDTAYLLDRLGLVWIYGKSVDWKAYHDGNHHDGKRSRLPLPGYAFDPHKFMLGFTPVKRSESTGERPKVEAPGAQIVEAAVFERTQLPDNFEAPANDTEEQIAAAFRDIFGLDRISVHDDFFELGGDSLKVITLAATVHRQLNVEVPMEEVFKHPTVRELSSYVKDAARENVFKAIPLAPGMEYYPLSPMQKRVFILEQIEGRGMAYNQHTIVWWDGDMDIEKMSRVCAEITRRHESLRTGFTMENGEPVQKVYPMEDSNFQVELIEMPDLEEAVTLHRAGDIVVAAEIKEIEPGIDEKSDALRAVIDRYLEPFDLATPPLWRVGFIKGGSDRGLFLTSIHHIVSDDISIGIVMDEMRGMYHDETFPELKVQYKDFAVWYRDQAGEGMSLDRQKKFWLDTFHVSDTAGLPALDLPYDFPRPLNQSFLGDRVNQVFGAGIKKQLHDMARQNKTTMFVFMFSLYVAFLYKCTGQEDIIVGTPITGRSHLDLQGIVGMFVNTLALRARPMGEQTFTRFLAGVREHTLDAFSNQFYQFQDLVEELDIQRDISRNPLFDTMFVLHTVDMERMTLTGVNMAAFNFTYPSSKFDLSFNVSESSASVNIMWEYGTDVFTKETVSRFADYFTEIMNAVLENPEATLDQITGLQPKREPLPQDFTFKKLSASKLQEITETYGPREIYQLVPMQEGMYVYSLYADGLTPYFQQIHMTVKSPGPIDIDSMRAALEQLHRRHEVLRSRFLQLEDGRLIRVVLKEPEGDAFYYEDISDMDDKESHITGFIENRREQPFDLAHDALLQLAVHRIDDNTCHLTWSYHNIIMDRGAAVRLIGLFFDTDKHRAGGTRTQLEAQTFTDRAAPGPQKKEDINGDYLRWFGRQNGKAAGFYWGNYLEGYSEPCSVPILDAVNAGPGGAVAYKHQEVALQLNEEDTRELTALIERHRVSLDVVMRAVWGLLLGKYNGRGDVVFGAVLPVRPAEFEQMTGIAINTAAVRVKTGENMTFVDLIRQLHNDALDMEPHAWFPLGEIQNRSTLKHALLDHILVVESRDPASLLIEEGKKHGFDVTRPGFYDHTHFEFNVTVTPGERLNINLICSGNVYKENYVKQLANHLHRLFKQILAADDCLIEDMTLLTDSEKERIVQEFNNTEAEFPSDSTIIDLFDRQVKDTPDFVAVMTADPEDQNGPLTYCELYRAAEELAAHLNETGIGTGDIVALMLERSLEMMVALFGILKAGAAYLPIAVDYPAERTRFILEDSAAKLLITSHDTELNINESVNIVQCQINISNSQVEIAHSSQLTAHRKKEKDVEKGDRHEKGDRRKNDDRRAGPVDLAYVIYTSGSTGKPKGTMIEHRSLVNRLNWMQNAYPIEDTDVILQKTPYVFDVSLWELFWWSSRGASVCMLGPGDEKNPESIIDAVEHANVTVMHFVPSMLNMFLQFIEGAGDYQVERLAGLHRVFASGEALAVHHVRQFHKLLTNVNSTELVNLYGPTEATVDVSYYATVPGESRLSIPIGKPIDNTGLWVMDESMRIQPPGIPGELYISGTGVARGYLNNPELTIERFIKAHSSKLAARREGESFPVSYELPATSFYKTGDLVRYLPDGNIEFLGRIDFQVKVRGYRIELGEIENRLSAHDGVSAAVVLAKDDGTGDKVLCAFVVSSGEEAVPEDQLKTYLSRDLPEYMIPSFFIGIPEIPLTPNGKADRKALTAMDTVGMVQATVAHAEPTSQLEQAIAEAWKEALGIEQVGIDNNFFDIGGNSLRGIMVINHLKKSLDRDIPIVAMFRYTTIRALAAFLGSEEDTPTRKDRTEEKTKGLDRLEQRRKLRKR